MQQEAKGFTGNENISSTKTAAYVQPQWSGPSELNVDWTVCLYGTLLMLTEVLTAK